MSSIQGNTIHRGNRAAERHQPLAAQYQSRDMTVGAVLRVFETERALETKPTVFAAAHAQMCAVHGLIDQLHPGRLAGITPQNHRMFRRSPRRTPECERGPSKDHQYQ